MAKVIADTSPSISKFQMLACVADGPCTFDVAFQRITYLRKRCRLAILTKAEVQALLDAIVSAGFVKPPGGRRGADRYEVSKKGHNIFVKYVCAAELILEKHDRLTVALDETEDMGLPNCA